MARGYRSPGLELGFVDCGDVADQTVTMRGTTSRDCHPRLLTSRHLRLCRHGVSGRCLRDAPAKELAASRPPAVFALLHIAFNPGYMSVFYHDGHGGPDRVHAQPPRPPSTRRGWSSTKSGLAATALAGASGRFRVAFLSSHFSSFLRGGFWCQLT